MTPSKATIEAAAARARNWARYVEHLRPIVERHRSGDHLDLGPPPAPRREPRPPVACKICGHRIGTPACSLAWPRQEAPTTNPATLP